MKISIIIVNYNVKYFLEQCLHSIYRSTGIEMNEVEVFVVDNASKDGSMQYLRKRFPAATYPGLHFIANKRNVGFGRANNRAVREAKGEYILFLNPDTLLTEHTLHDALEEADKHSDLGALGLKMLHTNGNYAPESMRGIPTPWAAFCKLAGLSRIFPKSKLFGQYYMQHLDRNSSAAIQIVSGAFMLTSRKAIEKVGSFDEDFFMYGEDIDLSYRFLKNGFQNYYCPTTILHYKGESTQKNTYHYVHVFYEAMLKFFSKHYRHYALLLSIPIKTAIFFSAFIALVSMQCSALKHFLNPRSFHRKQYMLYLGHHIHSIHKLADEYGLNIDTIHADSTYLPDGHLNLDAPKTITNYLHVIYDSHDYSIGQILDIFEHHGLKNVHIGVYSEQTGVLVTGSKVYTLHG